MMKKVLRKTLDVVLIASLLITYFITPLKVEAASKATTLAGLRQELSALQAKKRDADNKKAMTVSEKNQKNQAISNAKKEIETSEAKIEQAKNDIESNKKRIEELEKQIKELMVFYQQMSSDNAYMEFITESSSMTDMIMRSDAVKTLTSYNKEKLDEAENLIKQNEQLQVDLTKYENELNQNITTYQRRIEELDVSLLELSDLSMDINGEITTQQNLIKYYENLGCKENENLDVCASEAANNGWLKPTTKGRVTSLFGWRNLAGQSSYHSGIDIGLSEGTSVYSATNGTVINILYRQSCGGNQIYIQSIVNGEKYTILYAHLLSINVSIGQKVTNQTLIAKSGGYSTSTSHGGYDRCTTGGHLHLSVSKGYYKNWSTFVANLITPPGFPGLGGWYYSREQWFGKK